MKGPNYFRIDGLVGPFPDHKKTRGPNSPERKGAFAFFLPSSPAGKFYQPSHRDQKEPAIATSDRKGGVVVATDYYTILLGLGKKESFNKGEGGK